MLVDVMVVAMMVVQYGRGGWLFGLGLRQALRTHLRASPLRRRAIEN
jgi:hypothetical protein